MYISVLKRILGTKVTEVLMGFLNKIRSIGPRCGMYGMQQPSQKLSTSTLYDDDTYAAFETCSYVLVHLHVTSRRTVFLQRGSYIHSEKCYGMSHGSYYKISMILRQQELDPISFGGFVLYFASLIEKMQNVGICFHFLENTEILMPKRSCIHQECNYS